MKPRPTIFLSGVSHEFGSFRDAVEIEIQKKGCFVENQPSFATDYRTIEAMLRQKLSEADAVIHIVGFRYGAEPQQRPADKPRRSYTQMEFDIARELQKPVYVFLSQDASVRDAPNFEEKPEDPATAALQLAHREAVQRTDYLYYFFQDKDNLCRRAAAIQSVAAVDFRSDISRVDRYAPAALIGRDEELALLNDAWLKVRRAETPRSHVLTFVALGGEGKTSLVAKWAADLAHQGWPGCDAAFAWSFYSQGAREQFATSSDLFLKEAITFFGGDADKEFAASAAGAYEKGQRLARIVGQRHSLLILDGLEPLQYAPTSPTPGELKDHGIVALLKGLAANSKGLCIVTTRYSLPNLNAFRQTTAPEVTLMRLSREAGVDLLQSLGVKGSLFRNIPLNGGKKQVNEFEKLVDDVKGHALTLNLLGTYLRDAHGGDIRKRDLVRLEEADGEEQAGHAFRVMEAYEETFEHEGEEGQRALAILGLLGLFDRPMTYDCLEALLEKPAIQSLTEPLIYLNESKRNIAFKKLEAAKLLTVNRDTSGTLISLDAHALIREYFAKQLRNQQPAAWRAAHSRIYEHLSATTPDKPKPTLEDLEPLYQAVAHGCQAGLHQQVFDELYRRRIKRGQESYSSKKLGAFASDLGALAWFFETPWSRLSVNLADASQALLFNLTSFRLRALGRLTEALEPMKAALKMRVKQEYWQGAAINASNLAELELTLGHVTSAARYSKQSMTYADRTGDDFQRMGKHTTYGYVLYQTGLYSEAMNLFREAERLQVRRQPKHRTLYSLAGYRYCDLLLGPIERSAWQRILQLTTVLNVSSANSNLPPDLNCADLEETKDANKSHSDALCAVAQRATYSLEISERNYWPLPIGLDYLMLGRVALYDAVLSTAGLLRSTESSQLNRTIANAVQGLRSAGRQDYLPHALLTRAVLQFLTGTGMDNAREDLEEASEIAERGSMRLLMVENHLYRARLFFREAKYPWQSPRADLEAAEKLINECGYHRRDEELADAKRAILGI